MKEKFESMKGSLKVDSEPGLFKKKKKMKSKTKIWFSEINQNKNIFLKYLFIVLIIFLTSFSIYQSIVKSSSIEKLNQEKVLINRKIDEVSRTKKETKKKIAENTEKFQKLKYEEEKIDKMIQELYETIQSYEKQNKESTDKLTEYRNEFDTSKKEIQKLKDDIMQYKSYSSDLKQKNKELENEISNLNSQIENYKERISKIFDERNVDTPMKVKIHSDIITKEEQLDTILNWLNQGSYINFSLVYKGKRDGFSSSTFHRYVDGMKNTLTLIKESSGVIIGGFTSESWDGEKYKNDKKAFIFNLSTKEMFPVVEEKHAILCDPKNLVIFGRGDLWVSSNVAWSKFSDSYKKKNSKIPGLVRDNEKFFPIEIEVFQVFLV